MCQQKNLLIENRVKTDYNNYGKIILREGKAVRLSAFAGNAEVKYELAEAMSRRSLPHAIIIEGDKGCGKKTLAGILASYAVCSAEGERPCGVCSSCIKAKRGIHPDIVTLDGEVSGGLSVAAIREVRTAAYIKPNEAANKVYMLFNCEKMLPAAQNAFLKVLEEPPGNVMFILTAASSSALLQTVRSRSRILTLYPPPPSEAADLLGERFPEMDRRKITEAAENAGGNIGVAAELLQSGGDEDRRLAEEIFGAVFLSAEYPLLLLTSRLASDRSFAVKVLDRLCEITADCLRAALGATCASEKARRLSDRLSARRIETLLKNARRARSVLDINVNLSFYGTWLSGVLRSDGTGG